VAGRTEEASAIAAVRNRIDLALVVVSTTIGDGCGCVGSAGAGRIQSWCRKTRSAVLLDEASM